MDFTRILIVADIEGSSGCWNYRASSFMTPEWRRACIEMTRDVDAVVRSLFDAGAARVRVKDFHRTAYNILPGLVDPRAGVISGYRSGPVPGIGDPEGAEAVLFMGMHAASGTDGFLAHTLTSRLAQVEVNGRPLPEISLFAASLAPYGLRPIFFSGCPAACSQAQSVIPGIHTYAIEKSDGPERFGVSSWRAGLAEAAVLSLSNTATRPFTPPGPFRAVVTLREGEKAARKVGRRWGIPPHGRRLFFEAVDIHELYHRLIQICYLTPLTQRLLPIGLPLYNLVGRAGLAWVRRTADRQVVPIHKFGFGSFLIWMETRQSLPGAVPPGRRRQNPPGSGR